MLKNTAPEYLSNLLSLYTPQRTLRSALDITRMNVPRTNKVLVRKAFSVAGPRTWNNLPRAIRELYNVSQFRRSLKTQPLSMLMCFYTMCAMISMEERLLNINCYVNCYVMLHVSDWFILQCYSKLTAKGFK